MISRKAMLLAAASVLGLAGLRPGLAQTSPAATGRADPPVTDIVVTAERRSQSINSVPASIAAVTGAQLRSRGITSVADLQKIVPGFHYSKGTYDAPVYAIRGIGFNESSLGAKPDVSLSLDEVPLPFPIMANGVVLDLERVEVLKGPQGTLYGQNATGGAVNYIAAKPTRNFTAGASLSYGRFNAVDAEGYISGALTDTLTARLAAGTEQSDGWQKSYTRSATLGRADKTKGRLLLDWQPTDALKLVFSLNGFIDKSDTQAAQLIAVTPLGSAKSLVPGIINYPLSPANDQAADWDAGVPLHRNSPFYQAALRADYKINAGLTLTSISSYARYIEDRWQDPDGTSYQNILYHTKGDIHVASQEVRLSGTMDKLHWIFGGNYEYDKVNQRDSGFVNYDTNAYALVAFGGPYFTYYNLSRQQFRTRSVFASADYELTNRITAHAGVRYTQADASFNGCTGDGGDGALSTDFSNFGNFLRSFGGLPPVAAPPPGACVTLNNAFVPGPVSGVLNQNNVSWRAGIDWRPIDNTLLYATISKGYKSGSFPNLSASVATQVNPVVQESVLAYEVGVKTKALSDMLQFNAALFYYDYTNKQLRGRVIVPIFGALETLVNVPKSSIDGGEVDMTLRPLPGLVGTFGATYVNSVIMNGFTNYNPFGVRQNFNNEAFPLTPRWQGSADVQYDWDLPSGYGAYVGANYSYQSATNGGLGEQALLKINGYGLLDLRVGVRSPDDRWRLSLWGRNVTNQYYWTNADHIADTTVRFAGMPATFGVTLAYQFH